MGRDKALLPFHGTVLASHMAALVERAAGTVTLIGDPQKYGHLGYRVLPDRTPGAGPLGGIESALSDTQCDWNLIVACDMPAVSSEFLNDLLDAAEASAADAFLAAGPSGRLEPLTAVYHRRCGVTFRRALDAGVRKVSDAFAGLMVEVMPVGDPSVFQNLNTPEEWAGFNHDAH